MRILFTISILISLLSSCKTLNMYSIGSNEEGVQKLIDESQGYYPLINIDDKISVSIWGHEGMSVGSVFGIYNSNEVFGKWLLVSPDSMLVLPKLGNVNVVGLTVEELKNLLTIDYGKFIINPIIDVKIHSHEVSVIGQVIKPGNYPVYKGHNTLAYMIAAAGGTDYYAKLQGVNLARGNDNYVLDLTKMDPISMNQISLKPGDVLFFPTKSGKVLDKKSSTLLIGSSVLTTILLILTTRK